MAYENSTFKLKKIWILKTITYFMWIIQKNQTLACIVANAHQCYCKSSLALLQPSSSLDYGLQGNMNMVRKGNTKIVE